MIVRHGLQKWHVSLWPVWMTIQTRNLPIRNSKSAKKRIKKSYESCSTSTEATCRKLYPRTNFRAQSWLCSCHLFSHIHLWFNLAVHLQYCTPGLSNFWLTTIAQSAYKAPGTRTFPKWCSLRNFICIGWRKEFDWSLNLEVEIKEVMGREDVLNNCSW